MPMLPLLIGAGVGLLSASEQDKEASAERERAAATIAYSPYTGANINQAQASIHPAKYFASAGTGALAGLAAHQGNVASLFGGGTVNNVNNNSMNSAADSFQGLSDPKNNGFWDKAPDLNAQQTKGYVGGQFGFGPKDGKVEETEGLSNYGDPWKKRDNLAFRVRTPYGAADSILLRSPYGSS